MRRIHTHVVEHAVSDHEVFDFIYIYTFKCVGKLLIPSCELNVKNFLHSTFIISCSVTAQIWTAT